HRRDRLVPTEAACEPHDGVGWREPGLRTDREPIRLRNRRHFGEGLRAVDDGDGLAPSPISSRSFLARRIDVVDEPNEPPLEQPEKEALEAAPLGDHGRPVLMGMVQDRDPQRPPGPDGRPQHLQVVAYDRVGSKGADLLGKLLRDPSESDRAPEDPSGRSHLATTDPEAVPDLLLGQGARDVLDPGEHADLSTQTPEDAGLKHRPHDGPRFEQIRMEDDAYPHGPVTHRRALILPGLRAARPTESGEPVRVFRRRNFTSGRRPRRLFPPEARGFPI